MPDWYLYIIRCRGGRLYTGVSTDVARRLAQHRGDTGSRYLRGRGPLVLVFQARIGTRSLALKTERRVKKLPKAGKELLINSPGQIEELIRRATSAPGQ